MNFTLNTFNLLGVTNGYLTPVLCSYVEKQTNCKNLITLLHKPIFLHVMMDEKRVKGEKHLNAKNTKTNIFSCKINGMSC